MKSKKYIKRINITRISKRINIKNKSKKYKGGLPLLMAQSIGKSVAKQAFSKAKTAMSQAKDSALSKVKDLQKTGMTQVPSGESSEQTSKNPNLNDYKDKLLQKGQTILKNPLDELYPKLNYNDVKNAIFNLFKLLIKLYSREIFHMLCIK